MGRRRTGTAWEKPKGSGKWIAAITLSDGERVTREITRRTGAPVDQTYARSAAREWQRAYDEGEWVPSADKPGGKPGVHTVGTWVTAWSKTLSYASAEGDRWVAGYYLGRDPIAALPLRALAASDVVAWIERLKRTPSRQGGMLAARSVRRPVEILHRALRAAKAAGLIVADAMEALPPGALPAKRDKVPGARRGWRYDPDEVGALLTDPRVPVDRRVFYALAFGTGGRGGELGALRWSDWERAAAPLTRLVIARAVSMRARVLTEHATKTGAVKEVPVHPTLAAILAAWWSDGWRAFYGRAPTMSDPIVPFDDGRQRWPHKAWRQLQKDCRTIGIRPRKLHGTRHTTIRLARDAGADREAMRTITHAAPSTDAFDGYDSPSWERLCREVLKLEMGPRQSDSAPDSATTVSQEPAFPVVFVRNDLFINQVTGVDRRTEPQETQALRGLPWPVSAHSAPDSATSGALPLWAGERAAYAYLERAELEGVAWQA